MAITRSIARSGRTNTTVAVAAAISTPPPQAGVANANANAKTSKQEEPKMNKAEKRISEALSELLSLGASKSTIIKPGVKRQRIQAQHPDAAFYKSSTLQTRDAGKNGGLVAGSKHHYLRGL
jgi:hypothetical protein